MAASYPTSVASFTDKVDHVTAVEAAHVNSLQDEVAALESHVGPIAELPDITAVGGGAVTKRVSPQVDALYDWVSSLNSLKAPKASPTFTGTPAAPTAAAGTNTTQLATTAFVRDTDTPWHVGAFRALSDAEQSLPDDDWTIVWHPLASRFGNYTGTYAAGTITTASAGLYLLTGTVWTTAPSTGEGTLEVRFMVGSEQHGNNRAANTTVDTNSATEVYFESKVSTSVVLEIGASVAISMQALYTSSFADGTTSTIRLSDVCVTRLGYSS